ncbi:MAG: hypothetical protein WB511_14505, partial [Nitrososphaeraceae archaeon]
EHEQNEKNRRKRPEKFPERSKEKDILLNYCYQIPRRMSWFDQSFDEIGVREMGSDSDSCKKAILDQEVERRDFIHRREPTNKLLQTESASYRDSKKHDDIYWKCRKNNPTNTLYCTISKIVFMCECTEDSLRNGKICNVCKLTKMVNTYILNLFREAAEDAII